MAGEQSWQHRARHLLFGDTARQGYFAAADQALISLTNFLATVMVARFATPTDLGVYAVGFSALTFVRNTMEGLVIQPLSVYGAGLEEDEFSRYTSSTAILQLALASLTALVSATGGWLLIQTGNDVAGPALFHLWFVLSFWQLQEFVRRLLYTRRRVFAALLNTLLGSLMRFGLLWWWSRTGTLNGVRGLEAIGWGAVIALLAGLWANRRVWRWHGLTPRQTWWRNWEFGRWMMGSTLANWISVEFYPVLTAGLVSFAAAGAYRAIQNLVAPIHALLRATDTFLTPRAAEGFRRQGSPALQRVLRLSYFFNGLPVLALLGIALLFPRQILGFLYGETYTPYSQGVVLMAIFYALWFAYWPLQTVLKASRQSKPIFIANLVAIALMFSLGILAIRLWGVYGTLAGQILNAFVVNVVLWTAWRRLQLAWQNATSAAAGVHPNPASSDSKR
ncbi:MAG: Membrane protein [Anaerolineae bacterium]|nr:MAG: Membrane protein [Anaerolineae bacterium]